MARERRMLQYRFGINLASDEMRNFFKFAVIGLSDLIEFRIREMAFPQRPVPGGRLSLLPPSPPPARKE